VLPKERRIKKKSEFDLVFDNPNVIRIQIATIFWNLVDIQADQKSDQVVSDNPSKFAVVTSKKIGAATVRNHLRRQVFEIIYRHEVYQKASVYVVVVMKPEANGLTFEMISNQLNDAFSKIMS
jgi:ribonuclease P protein component